MKPRCQSTHPTKGTKCGLPEGHKGRHQNGNAVNPWDDQPMHCLGRAGFVVVNQAAPVDDNEMLFGEVS